jgi:hypothetical protein
MSDLPLPLPADIEPRQRRTRLTMQIENHKIMELKRTGASDYYIQQQLHIRHKNYEKRIAKLRDEDLKETLDKQTAEAKAQLIYTLFPIQSDGSSITPR